MAQTRRRAFVSVTDKRKLDRLKGLTDFGWKIVSTGGTAKRLGELNIPCTEVSDVTGFPEILDGRVKSMHPLITGAMLGDTTNPEHVAQMEQFGIVPFELVIVNLYNFMEKPCIENIDVGGPTAIRSAAKNAGCVAVVTDPNDYDWVVVNLINDGEISPSKREFLAIKSFRLTAAYDAAIAGWMSETALTGPIFTRVSESAH